MSDVDGLPRPLTDRAETVSDVWSVFLPIAIGVFAMVVLLVLYVVIRYRRREGGLPPQNHYNIPVEVAYTTIPFLLIAGLFALTVVSIDSVTAQDDTPDVIVDVLGFQWQWQFGYPDAGVEITGTNEEIPTLVLPAGQTVRFNLESADVIHSFWVPGFLFKRDVFPDHPSSFDVKLLDRTGSYSNGACAEFCGVFHDRMRFYVRVLAPADFDAWLAEQSEVATP